MYLGGWEENRSKVGSIAEKPVYGSHEVTIPQTDELTEKFQF